MDQAISQRVLAETLGLLQTQPYDRVTMEAVAEAAGISRQTLYRRYASRQVLILAALAQLGEEEVNVRRTGNRCRDVEDFLARTFTQLRRMDGPIRALLVQAQSDAASREALRTGLVAHRREALAHLLHSLPDVPMRIDIAFGVMWYRFMIGHAPLDRTLARDLAARICD